MRAHNMHPVKSLVFVKGELPGIILGQLFDQVNGHEYNVLYTDRQGSLKEEWIHSKDIKKAQPTPIDCAQ